MSLQASDFPAVPPDRFEKWRRLELKSIDLFLIVAAAVLLLALLGQFALGFVPRASRGPTPGLIAGAVFMGTDALTFIVGLTVSAIVGSRAARLKKALGIHWR